MHLAQPWAPPRTLKVWPWDPSAACCWAAPGAVPGQALAPCLPPHGLSLRRVWFLVFSAFSAVAKTLPVPRNRPSSKQGCQGATAALQGMAVPNFCALVLPRSLSLLRAPPRAFLGLTQHLEGPPDREGRGAGHAACTQRHTCSCPAPGTGAFRLCGHGETGRVKGDTLDREQKPRVQEEGEGWSRAGRVTSRGVQGHGDTPSTNPRSAWK